LPQLSEALIRGMASGSSFERGKSYYHSAAILDPVRQGMELRAECQGSQYEPYQVSATLTGKGVGGTTCTCPYSGAGICKHVVALLLAYIHEPQAFRVIPPLEALLAPRSQQELIALIALHEEDVPRALQQLPRMQPWELEHYQWQVAQAAEKSHPRQALSLYTELVGHAIAGWDRRAYH
jgi:uncharacterized Zn finger protein